MFFLSKFLNFSRAFYREHIAATAIEYALIAAAIALAIVAIVFALGGDVSGMFGDVQTEIETRTAE